MTFSTIILAAGNSTRFKSALPKSAHNLLGKPILRWVVDAAWAAGSAHVVVVLSPNQVSLREIASDCLIAEQKAQIGNANAVQCAHASLNEVGAIATGSQIVVMSGDVPLISAQSIIDLVAPVRNGTASASILSSFPKEASGYGRVIKDSNNLVVAIKEEADASETERQIAEVNTGTLCFDSELLYETLPQIANNNKQGELYLTDAIELLAKSGSAVAAVPLPAEQAYQAQGINTRQQLAIATRLAQKQINYTWMSAGVTLLAPLSTIIGPDVQLSSDVVVEPNVQILGSSSIGEQTIIGANSKIVNSTLGTNCNVQSSQILESAIGNNCEIGPYAHLRPGNLVADNCKVGFAVQLKSSVLHAGTKAAHLNYIGDSEIGENTNIGGLFITANYDGKTKHRTKIGENVFVGSNAITIAPVTIGDNAVIAAGSAITEDVPDNALAIARARQENKLDWVKQEDEGEL